MGKLRHWNWRTAPHRCVRSWAPPRNTAGVVYANSLGAEAMVLTDIIASDLPQIDMFSIDTGRLHEETYESWRSCSTAMATASAWSHPEAAALERLVGSQGVNGFYGSVEARMACCRVRKVEPFRARSQATAPGSRACGASSRPARAGGAAQRVGRPSTGCTR